MSDLFKDIQDFHVKYGLEYEGKPRTLNEEMGKFRIDFLQEELTEYTGATQVSRGILSNNHLMGKEEAAKEFAMSLEDSLDALIDLVYVALGTAYLHGFNFQEGWDRVHAANMTKVRAKSAADSTRGTAYDIVKPEGWTPPRHTDLVEDHAHREELS